MFGTPVQVADYSDELPDQLLTNMSVEKTKDKVGVMCLSL